MNNIHIWKSIGTGWRQFSGRPWYMIGIAGSVIGIVVMVSVESAFAALSYIIMGGYFAFLLKYSNSENVVFDDLFAIDQRWIQLAFLGVIKTILIMLGFLCFIIPGIYLSIRWMFAELLIVDEGLRPLEALARSSEMTKGVKWKLFGWSIIALIGCIVGVVLLLVGFLAASTIFGLSFIALYKERKAQAATEEVSVPTIDDTATATT